ncbi:stress responsive A/B barrel domain protein [Xylaria arbuscula]|nr:stress responsive A/B barrel domain protein [Xylaria arbuscula]
MTIIHIVIGKLKSWVTQEQSDHFILGLKSLKTLPCVKDGRVLVGGPSLTEPIEQSRGLQHAFVSYHENMDALNDYQVAKVQFFKNLPYDDPLDYETVIRFDFEVAKEDEHLCEFGVLSNLKA